MATITRAFDVRAQIIGSGDGWATLSGTTPTVGTAINLTAKAGVDIECEVDFDSTPTDYVDVKVYGSHDGTNYDDTPITQVRIDKATDPNQITLTFGANAPAYLHVAMVQSGSTDSHNVRCYHRTWTWSSA